MTARFELTLQYLRSYVVEWFDQNPLGQVGIILMRDRLSEVLVPMGGELVYRVDRMSCSGTEHNAAKSAVAHVVQVTRRRSSRLWLINGNWSLPESRVCRMASSWLGAV